MQTQTSARQSAEEEIFALRKKIDQYAAAGDVAEVSRLQLKISELQQKHGAVTGVEREENERTA
jgi:outer membrane protein TolC